MLRKHTAFSHKQYHSMTQLLLNFITPSGSGQKLITMPVMAPLADLIGVTRQTAVLAFQLGDGFLYILYLN